MAKIRSFPEFFRKYGYILIAAAWCVTVAIIVDRYWAPESSLSLVHKRVSQSVKESEEDFSRLTADTALLKKAISGNYDQKFIKSLTRKKYFLFFYSEDENGEKELQTWNTQKVLPSPALLYLEGKSGFSLLQNGYYVWNNFEAPGIKVLALIPVKWNYFVTNDYLKNDFAASPNTQDAFELKAGQSEGEVVSSIHGKELFRIAKKTDQPEQKNNSISVLLYILATVIFLFFI